MAYDGSLVFDTKIDQSGFNKGASQIEKTGANLVKTLGLTLSATAIISGLTNIAKASVNLASDLAEVQNVVDVAFGDGAEMVNEWAKSAASAYGLSELSAKRYVGTMGSMLASSGVATESIRDMSTALTGLAGDFASFYNITSDEAFAKIRAGISGETEPLKQLGINMSVANLEAYALAQGIEKSYNAMSQAEQVMLRYNYLLSVSENAQGDFTRTSESFANQQRITELAIQNIGTAIGNILLPTATRATKQLGEFATELERAITNRGISGAIDFINVKFPVATAAVKGLATAYGSLLIIKTVSKGMAAYQTALLQVSLASMGTTAATVAQSGAFTANEIVVAALTGKINLLTAAQALFNKTALMNPYVAVAAGIGALVGAVVLARNAYLKANPEIAENISQTKALNNASKELQKTLEDSEAAYKESLDGIEKNAIAAETLYTKLAKISDGYQGTAAEQQIMTSLCDELNSSVEGLNISYDKQSGKLSMTAEAMREYIAAAKERARVDAYMERYTELVNKQAEAEYNLYLAKLNYAEAERLTANSTSGYNVALKKTANAVMNAESVYESLNSEIAEYEAFLGDAVVSTDEATTAIDENSDALNDNADAQERVVIAGYDVTDAIKSAGLSADDATKRFEAYSAAATNMFDRISTESELSTAEMIANLDANAQAMEAYGENMAFLAGKIPDDLYAALAGDPEKMAGVVQELASSSDEKLAALSESFSAAGESAKQAWLDSIGAVSEADNNPAKVTAAAMEADKSMEKAAQEVVQRTSDAMDLAVQTADFSVIGENIANDLTAPLNDLYSDMYIIGDNAMQGLINGIKNRQGDIKKAINDIADITSKTFRLRVEIASPSKLFYKYGKFITEGLANGIRSQLGIVRNASWDAASASANAFTDSMRPTDSLRVRESLNSVQQVNNSSPVNVTQNIYAQKQSPAAILREARWQQERAVMVGV